MTAIELLALLNQQGVVLSVDGANLRISAPSGSLTDDIRAKLQAHKAELIDLLADSATGSGVVDLRDYAGPLPREAVPLSFAQERLWFIDELEPGNTQYNLPSAVSLAGELDVEALRRALDALALRHECLRTVFARAGREPRARVLTTMSCPLVMHDAAGWPADELRAALTRLCNEPFSLGSGPLLRIHLLRQEPSRHLLLLIVHHIISDGVSLGRLLQELADLYRQALDGNLSTAAATTPQYADFAAWQRATLRAAELERLQRYWRDQLAGAPLRLDLPTDYPRPAAPSYRGDWCHEQLPAATLAALRSLARAHDATLYTLLLTAFAALLFRYSRQADLLIGSPVAGRQLSATETMQGLFVNSVVIRAQIEPSTRFADLLGQVTRTTLDALSHQSLPFEKLVEMLAPDREPAMAPVFQVLFNMQNREAELPEFAGLTAAPVVV
ncbi:MAG: condensation domain-containing protein, partial [Gammaproteobacteria bacterium]|nr:condensation domain-containing protein [Gammaproteobacteria bacterium]